MINDELNPYFDCDVNRSEAVTAWAYQVAVNNKAQLWSGINCFQSSELTKVETFV